MTDSDAETDGEPLDLAKLMTDLRDGNTTIEAAAERVRRASWPEGDPADERTADPLGDRSFATGSWDEISRALHLGWIDIDQYGLLVDAYGDSRQ